MKHRFAIIILVTGTVYLLLPFLSNPELFLYRSNDLEEFFWPLMIYVKRSIIDYHTIPVWNNLWFAGMPLIADPQAPLFYPLNSIFLFFPIKIAFILSITVHTIGASLAMYIVGLTLRLHKRVAVGLGLLYVGTPRFAAILEAGHYGLISAWMWIPFVLLFGIILSHKPSILRIVGLSFSCSMLLVSHAITAVITVPLLCIVSLLYSNNRLRLLGAYALAAGLTVGFVAPVLLPQLLWQGETTRYLLLATRETFPVWIGKQDFLINLVKESTLLVDQISFDTEKVIAPGTVAAALFMYGFLKSTRNTKLLILSCGLIVTLILLNNSSPIYPLLKQSNLFVLMRVSTRLWPIALIGIYLVACRGLMAVKNKKLQITFVVLAVLNVDLLSWATLNQQRILDPQVSTQLYEYLKADPDIFRVYCLTGCLSQRLAAENNLELIDGYATLIPRTFYQQSWGLFGGYWDYYTLRIPPFGTYEQGKLAPDFEALGEYNVKYIISPFKINNSATKLLTTIDGLRIYKNLRFKTRIFGRGSQNVGLRFKRINAQRYVIEVEEAASNVELIFSNTYTPGWSIYTKDHSAIAFKQSPSKLSQATLTQDRHSLEIQYEPPGLRTGVLLSISSILVTIGYFFLRLRRFSSIKSATPKNNA